MVARIHRLAAHMANQIAAGEVVERPASVVKECVENSLDAGANKIIITVNQGGLQTIRIQDDGAGIHADDLVLAVSRHATSKIREVADLQQIRSLGFRGEALASIASVSHFTLVSRTASSDCAWQIRVDALAHCSAPEPAAHPIGTTIDIQSLFYNTPARRKFLRSDKTEALHIQEIVRRLALANFNVALTLHVDDRVVYQLPAIQQPEDKYQRIAKICGKNFLEQAIEIDFTAPGLRLWGWLGVPSLTRSQADGQYFFINGRIVRDKLIQHALRVAYQEVVYPGRYPLYVLYLECDPKELDVNVHPTKHEVRFHNARHIHDFITQKLTPVILNQPQAPDFLAPATATTAQTTGNFPWQTNTPHFAALPRRCDHDDAKIVITRAEIDRVPHAFIAQRYAIFLSSEAVIVIDCQQLAQHSSLAALLQSPPDAHTTSATWQQIWQTLAWQPGSAASMSAPPAGVKIMQSSDLQTLFDNELAI